MDSEIEKRKFKVPSAIVTASCNVCAHSCPRKPHRTRLERWEEDTRPERPKGFLGALKWLLNPNQFRDEHPYDGSKGIWSAETWDKIELRAREQDIVCSLMPEHIMVSKKHYCGQFKPKTVIGD